MPLSPIELEWLNRPDLPLWLCLVDGKGRFVRVDNLRGCGPFNRAEAVSIARAAGYKPRKCWGPRFVGPWHASDLMRRLPLQYNDVAIATILVTSAVADGLAYLGTRDHLDHALAHKPKPKPKGGSR